MNFVKPTVRIALMRQVNITLHGTSEEVGPSYWAATANLSTTEGQGVSKTFMGMKKEDALGKAYHFLKMCMKHNTLSLDTAERREAESNKSPEERAYSERAAKAFEDYMQDKITVHEYRELRKRNLPGTNYHPAMDERCDPVPEPGPKWKWYNWFYNPQD